MRAISTMRVAAAEVLPAVDDEQQQAVAVLVDAHGGPRVHLAVVAGDDVRRRAAARRCPRSPPRASPSCRARPWSGCRRAARGAGCPPRRPGRAAAGRRSRGRATPCGVLETTRPSRTTTWRTSRAGPLEHAVAGRLAPPRGVETDALSGITRGPLTLVTRRSGTGGTGGLRPGAPDRRGAVGRRRRTRCSSHEPCAARAGRAVVDADPDGAAGVADVEEVAVDAGHARVGAHHVLHLRPGRRRGRARRTRPREPRLLQVGA